MTGKPTRPARAAFVPDADAQNSPDERVTAPKPGSQKAQAQTLAATIMKIQAKGLASCAQPPSEPEETPEQAGEEEAKAFDRHRRPRTKLAGVKNP